MRVTMIPTMILASVMLSMIAGCSSDYPRYRSMSDERIAQCLTQREHQVLVYWRGENRWNLDATGFGGGGHWALDFEHTPSFMVEKVLSDYYNGRLPKRPTMLLPLLGSKDPEVVLTALYAYRIMGDGRLRGRTEWHELADAFRRTAQTHKDARIRFAAFDLLMQTGWIEPSDLKWVLADECDSIVLRAVSWPGRFLDPLAYDYDGSLRRQIVPVLIDHLNHNHFCVRDRVFSMLRDCVTYRKPGRAGGYSLQLPSSMPQRIDWARADWHTRHSAQQALKEWWAGHADEAIEFCRPRQPATAP